MDGSNTAHPESQDRAQRSPTGPATPKVPEGAVWPSASAPRLVTRLLFLEDTNLREKPAQEGIHPVDPFCQEKEGLDAF